MTPALGDALAAALARLELVAFATGPVVSGSRIELGARVIRVGGTCPGTDLVAIEPVPEMSSPACVATAAWRDVLTAFTALAGQVDDVMDVRPAGFAIDHLELSGGTLALVKRPTITIGGVTHPADAERVAELLRALAQPSSARPLPVATDAPELTLLITPVVGPPVQLELFAGSVHRQGEPRALAIGVREHEVLARPARAYVDSERWSEEPSTISELTLDQITYRRGAVIGEWTREPAGPFDPALVEILATAAARLHAPVTPGTFTAGHQLALRFSPPVGALVTRKLAVGPVGGAQRGSCAGELEGERVSLPAELCIAVAAVAAH